MFITTEELKSAIYAYQAQEISDGDNDVLLWNIEAAVSEVKSYLNSRYNVDAVFSAEGEARNPLILELTKNIAVWYIIRLSNIDIIYQQAKERYDAAIDWLKQVAAGTVAPALPKIETPDGEPLTLMRFGSHEKFDHSF